MSISSEEIEKLPKQAQVAFAARCAQRVVGLFEHIWLNVHVKHICAVHRMVAIAQNFAQTGKLTAYDDDANLNTLTQLVNDPDANAGIDAARAAFSAANSANSAHAAKVYAVSYPTNARSYANDAINSVSNAAHAAHCVARAVNAVSTTDAAQESDLRQLLYLAKEQNWNDETPVLTEILGPLWPDGPPPNWPISAEDGSYLPPSEITFSIGGEELAWPVAEYHPKAEPRRGARLDVTLDIPVDMDDEAAQAAVRELYDALNELHVASGGSGLVVEDYQSFVEQFVEVEV